MIHLEFDTSIFSMTLTGQWYIVLASFHISSQDIDPSSNQGNDEGPYFCHMKSVKILSFPANKSTISVALHIFLDSERRLHFLSERWLYVPILVASMYDKCLHLFCWSDWAGADNYLKLRRPDRLFLLTLVVSCSPPSSWDNLEIYRFIF